MYILITRVLITKDHEKQLNVVKECFIDKRNHNHISIILNMTVANNKANAL